MVTLAINAREALAGHRIRRAAFRTLLPIVPSAQPGPLIDPGSRAPRSTVLAARMAGPVSLSLASRKGIADRTQNADYALLNDTARAVILCAREPNVLGHPSYRWE